MWHDEGHEWLQYQLYNWCHTNGLSDVTLPRLKHLTYLRLHGSSSHNLLQLKQLTSLSTLVISHTCDVAVGPSSVPGLALPASLKALLWFPVEAGLLSLVPTGLQDLQVECAEGPAEGAGSLLSGMSPLQHLTELSLEVCGSLAWPLLVRHILHSLLAATL